MGFPAGTLLGPYEIVAAIGAGGMGEVYRARDTRLGRTVAVKVLPTASRSSPSDAAGASGGPRGRLAERLAREARLISSLNHPGICGLFDIGNEGGVEYLVMEFLEGEPLSRRIARGPLPLAEALQHAAQIAEALAFAHRRGVIHRDLKPDNVMLTPSGAKLLDFGLARVAGGAEAALEGLESARGLTTEGHIVGTVDYMSPEQLQGRPADERSDIFSFGALLFEMLTSRRAFAGETQASVMGAILHTEPPSVSGSRSGLPPGLDRLVQKCLRKDPDDRWQSSRDLADELRWLLSSLGSGEAAFASRLRRLFRVNRLAGALAALLLLGAGGVLGWRLSPRSPAAFRAARLSVTVPANEPFAACFGTSLAFSPDGRTLAYLATVEGARHLHVRPLAARSARRLPGTEGAESPFFSPDGARIAFFADGRLKTSRLEGDSQPSTLADAPQGAGGVWLPDDTIVFAPGYSSGLYRIPAGGGRPQPLTFLDARAGERTHRWPDLLPGGEEIVFVAGSSSIASFDEARVETVSLRTGRRRLVLAGASYVRALPPLGRGSERALALARGGELSAIRLDEDARPTGAPVSLGETARTASSGAASFAFSATGDLLCAEAASGEGQRRLAWADRQGRVTPLSDHGRSFSLPSLSPGGDRVAVVIKEAVYDVWIMDVTSGALARLTLGASNASRPVWSRDGREIFFGGWGPGQAARIWSAPADSSQKPAPLVPGEGTDQRPSSVSPDGRLLLVNEFSPSVRSDVRAIPLGAPGPGELLVHSPAGERDAVVSRDGRLLAYVSNETGRDEVYVRPFPGPGGRSLVSAGGGAWPVFSPVSDELFYRVGNRFFAAELRGGRDGSAPSVGRRSLLFDVPLVDTRFDVDPAGSRFLVVLPGPAELAPVELTVVLGALEDVRARLRL